MNKSLALISLILLGIFIASISNTYHSINNSLVVNFSDSTIESFDPALQQISGFNETEKRISTMLLAEKQDEKNLKLWIIILNLTVTIATGATTLITTINTAKSKSLTFKASVVIAVIAFFSTIISFTQGQINTSKENTTAKITEIKKIRDEMESLKPDELPGQLPIINRNLDDL